MVDVSMLKDPKALHDALIAAHEEFYKTDATAQMTAMLFLYRDDGASLCVVIPMGDEEQKEHLSQELRSVLRDCPNIIMYAFTSEVWVGSDPKRAPSDCEDRKEGVITSVVTRDGTNITSIVEVNRDWTTGGAILSAPQALPGTGIGRFANLFDDE